MGIAETDSYTGNVDIRITIDDEEIWSIQKDMSGVEPFPNIDAYKLRDPSIGDHQIIVEITNGVNRPDDIYILEYLTIQYLHLIEFERFNDKNYVVPEIHLYSEEFDNAMIAFSNLVPSSLYGEIFRPAYRAGFSSSFVFSIDSGYNGPDEWFDDNPWGGYLGPNKMGSAIYYAHAFRMEFKVLDPEENFLESSAYSEFFPFGILPSVSQEKESSEILHLLETINFLSNILPIPEKWGLIFAPLDVALYILPEDSPPNSNSGMGDSNTAFASWTTDYEPFPASGLKPNPQFDEKASMKVNWGFDLPNENPILGAYQVITTWTIEIYKFQAEHSFIPGYGWSPEFYTHTFAFDISETSYTNFLYLPQP